MLKEWSDGDRSLKPAPILDQRFWRGFTVALGLLIVLGASGII
jgi:hypothetical protein